METEHSSGGRSKFFSQRFISRDKPGPLTSSNFFENEAAKVLAIGRSNVGNNTNYVSTINALINFIF